MAPGFVVADVALTVQSRVVMLDAMLLLLIFATLAGHVRFARLAHEPDAFGTAADTHNCTITPVHGNSPTQCSSQRERGGGGGGGTHTLHTSLDSKQPIIADPHEGRIVPPYVRIL